MEILNVLFFSLHSLLGISLGPSWTFWTFMGPYSLWILLDILGTCVAGPCGPFLIFVDPIDYPGPLKTFKEPLGTILTM